MTDDIKNLHVRRVAALLNEQVATVMTLKQDGSIEVMQNRNDKGYPLKEDGTIDWEKTSEEKDKALFEYEKLENTGRGIKHPKPTNITPKKKKRKKKN
jgi:hypothetical protein